MDGTKTIQVFFQNINNTKNGIDVSSSMFHTLIGLNQWNTNTHTVDPEFAGRIRHLRDMNYKKRKATVNIQVSSKKKHKASLLDQVFIGANKYMPEHVLIQENKKLLYIFYPSQLNSDNLNIQKKTMNKIKKYIQTKVSEPGYVIKYVPYYRGEDNRDIYILSSDLGRGGKMHQIDLIVSPYINNMNSNKKKPVIRITNIPTRNND
jgi:hypothetical protein